MEVCVARGGVLLLSYSFPFGRWVGRVVFEGLSFRCSCRGRNLWCEMKKIGYTSCSLVLFALSALSLVQGCFCVSLIGLLFMFYAASFELMVWCFCCCVGGDRVRRGFGGWWHGTFCGVVWCLVLCFSCCVIRVCVCSVL